MRSGDRRRHFAWGAGLLLALALAAPAHAPGADPLATAVQADAREAHGPLDLREVSLGQRDVRMVLRIVSGAAWTAKELTSEPGRALCVTLVGAEPVRASGNICVTRREGSPALSFTPLAADGAALAPRVLAADISRPRPGVLEATFLPVAAGLSVGPYGWFAHSAWTDEAACASTCADRAPDAGIAVGGLRLLAVPHCFGAAARDPDVRCQNPDLRLALEPPLSRAGETFDSYCEERTTVPLSTCAFGAAREDAAATFALVGDSHAAGLKTALEVVSLAKRWRGVSMIRAACPATRAARPILPTRARSRQCVVWNRRVLAWLAAHREVSTVFLSAHTTAEVAPTGGRTMTQTARAGYRDEIRALLRRVERVVVVRDTPSEAPGHLTCVARALDLSRPPGPACARTRAAALENDPLAAAARAMRSPRVRVIDPTSRVCDDRRCFPVVGGALVHRNETHITPAFSASLGPFILRALDR